MVGRGDAGEEEDGEDVFDRGEEVVVEDREEDLVVRAVQWLRDELEVPREGGSSGSVCSFRQTPLFLGYGVEDDRVSVVLGRNAAACLEALGVQTVRWSEYEGLEHWYSSDMLRDIVEFVRASTNWD